LKSPGERHPGVARCGADERVGRVVEDRLRDACTGEWFAGLRRNAQNLSVIENRSLSGKAGLVRA